MLYDALIVGGGPAGLSAALALGRARKRVVVCDAGPPRNERAQHLYNFVTRDGIPPAEFRRIGREQLQKYAVDFRTTRITSIEGETGNFQITTEQGPIAAKRVLLATGMVDTMLPQPGFSALWGHSIFQCPFCHGWEIQDQPFAYIPTKPEMVEWGIFLQQWSQDVIVCTDGKFEVPEDPKRKLAKAGIVVEERAIARFEAHKDNPTRLDAIVFRDGTSLPRSAIFAHPPQAQSPLVMSLGLTTDDKGFLQVDGNRQTSRSGIYAAGDLSSPMQGALLAASAGMMGAMGIIHSMVDFAHPGATHK